MLGVLVGYAIVELSRLRAMIAKLEQDVARLRRQLTEADAPAQTAPQPQPQPQPREFPGADTRYR